MKTVIYVGINVCGKDIKIRINFRRTTNVYFGHKCCLLMTSEFLESHCNSSSTNKYEFSHFFLLKMLYLYKIEKIYL